MENAVNEVDNMVKLVQEWDAILPHWAIRIAQPGILEVGAQLCTRDGRRMGNAHIIGFKEDALDTGRPYYHVMTDAGTRMVMNSTEINDSFWPPRWISDVKEVLRKFDREASKLEAYKDVTYRGDEFS